MKKPITLLFLFLFMGRMANATIYYVDPTSGSNTGTGQTWATAVKNIEQAQVLADGVSGIDDIYVKGGTLSFPGSTLTVRATNDVNLYGSFKGIESSPSERPLIDQDGNGIVESWEFQYPTTITSANSNNGVVLASAIFDGFTITHVGTKTTGLMSSIVGAVGATFQNNIVKNSLITITINGTSGYDGILVKAIGTFKSCLFEKNTVNAIVAFSSGGSDKYFAPIMGVSGGSTVTGCVFRNNKGIVDCSGSTAGATGSVKGVIVNLYGAASGSTYLTNCLIYNNEAVYIPGTAAGVTATLTSGCIVGTSGASTNYSSNYIINNTIVNNRSTNTGNGGAFLYNNGAIVNYFENNVLWNNQLGSVVKNLAINSNVTTGRIGFNVMNKGGNGTFTVAATLNNFSDLTLGNITSPDSLTAPRFKTTTTVAGCNRIAGSSDSIAIAKADWRILANSYLIGKGTTTTVLTDKAGKPYATNPSVGAYEFDASMTGINTISSSNMQLVIAGNRTIRFINEGNFEIISITGAIVWKGYAMINQSLPLASGYYIIRLVTANTTQKIVL